MLSRKVIRIKLKTGELLLRKAVTEFFIGRRFFVVVNDDETSEAFNNDNVASVEYKTKGEFVGISFIKRR